MSKIEKMNDFKMLERPIADQREIMILAWMLNIASYDVKRFGLSAVFKLRLKLGYSAQIDCRLVTSSARSVQKHSFPTC